MANPSPPDWAAVHSQTYVYEPGCWEKCSGFCCSSRHPDFSFRLLPSRGTAIFYFQEEYEWLAKQNLAPALDGLATRQTDFDFGGPEPLSFVFHFCGLEGGCQGKLGKPLHCLIYPFMPVLDNRGQLLDVTPGSIFDLTALLQTGQSLCPLWEERKDHYLGLWRDNEQLLAPLRHPRIIFYLAAYKIFSDSYAELFLRWDERRGLAGPDFWRAWELHYLGKRFFDVEALKALFQQKRSELETLYGKDF